MRTPVCPALPRALSGEPRPLVLRRAADEDDLEAVVAAHMAGFGDEDEITLRENLLHRPGARPSDVFLVEDTASGEVVSSVSLIREAWRYEGVRLPIAEVGIVSTRPAYRGRALVRAQFEAYHRLARREGCVLSIISGIEHYYRQFGYEYALPTGGGVTLRPEQIPDLPAGEESAWRVRPATSEDMPGLLGFYEAETRGLRVSAELTEAVWRYQDGLPEAARERRATWIVEEGGVPRGFLRTWARAIPEWGEGVSIQGAHLPHHDGCLAALRWAKAESLRAHGGRPVRVRLPYDAPLVGAARALGGEVGRPYGWLVRVLDPVALMARIAPVLERRLAESPFAGLSRAFTIGMMTESLVLRFRGGRFRQVSAVRRGPRADITLPPPVAPMVWFGSRSMEEVADWYADASIRDRSAGRLADVLFPKGPSWACSLF